MKYTNTCVHKECSFKTYRVLMKKLLPAIFLLLTNSIIAQSTCWAYWYNFEYKGCFDGIFIDSISNSNNIWEIGVPEKNIFTSAETKPNAIITDKKNPYPINDTSSFVIKKIADDGFRFRYYASISGVYYANSDTLNDYGLIELSKDNGKTWIDLINDSELEKGWLTKKPELSGNSNNWTYFHLDLLKVNDIIGIIPGDTLIYRFTFISDSKFDSLDGLMFDNLQFDDFVEGINKISFNKIKSKSFPNPTVNQVTISFENVNQNIFEIKVIDNLGKEVLKPMKTSENSILLDISSLNDGIYTYFIRNIENSDWSTGKIIKIK